MVLSKLKLSEKMNWNLNHDKTNGINMKDFLKSHV